jgi:hypothetical protein
MMSADEVRFRDLLASQLILTEDMWGVLVREGLTEEAEVRLDFAYRANAEADADALVSFLQAETDYEVSAAPDDTGSRVEGITRETTVTQRSSLSGSSGWWPPDTGTAAANSTDGARPYRRRSDQR